MKKPGLLLLAVAVMFALGGYVYGVGVVSKNLASTGAIFVENLNLSVNVTAIEWPTLGPGGTATHPILVTNTGNSALILSMTTAGLPDYLALTWNREGYTLSPGESVEVTLTLTASQEATHGAYEFSIILSGST